VEFIRSKEVAASFEDVPPDEVTGSIVAVVFKARAKSKRSNTALTPCR
jgi:hypothetical protein